MSGPAPASAPRMAAAGRRSTGYADPSPRQPSRLDRRVHAAGAPSVSPHPGALYRRPDQDRSGPGRPAYQPPHGDRNFRAAPVLPHYAAAGSSSSGRTSIGIIALIVGIFVAIFGAVAAGSAVVVGLGCLAALGGAIGMICSRNTHAVAPSA